MTKGSLKQKLRELAKPVKTYVDTVKSLTFMDIVYIGLFIAQNWCQSIVYWNFCKFFLRNDIPITVVLTGSMEPGFQRGDIMPVQSWDIPNVEVGDIVVYQQDKRPVPIVHRLLEKRSIMWPLLNESDNSTHKYQGDN